MSGRTARAVLYDLLFLVLFVHAALWVKQLYCAFGVASSPPKGDWFFLREVARSFIDGDWRTLYSDRELPSGIYFFRYPPVVLYLITPLAVIPPMIAYALVCAAQLAATAAALTLLFRFQKPRDTRLIVAGVFGSAALCHVIVSGQNSALMALAIAAAGLCWSSGRNVLAGACIGLLVCKPNWLPVFGVFVLWRGGLRAGAATVLVAVTLALSTLPLGIGVWRDFLTVTSRTGEIAAGYAAYKEITLLASLKSIIGWGVLTKVIWGLCLAGLSALGIRTISDARSIGRSLALITLLAVVINPYASYYDGLVLMVPATLWFTHRSEYLSRHWWSIAIWIAAYWFWDMAAFYYVDFVPGIGQPRVSAAGILLVGWFISEALARTPERSEQAVCDRAVHGSSSGPLSIQIAPFDGPIDALPTRSM